MSEVGLAWNMLGMRREMTPAAAQRDDTQGRELIGGRGGDGIAGESRAASEISRFWAKMHQNLTAT
jgi:hypothetical protein